MRLTSLPAFAVAAVLCIARPAFADTVDTFTLTNVNVDSLVNDVFGPPNGKLTGTISIDITSGTFQASNITWTANSDVFNDIFAQFDQSVLSTQSFADIIDTPTEDSILIFDLRGSLIGYSGGDICSESNLRSDHLSGIDTSSNTLTDLVVSGSLDLTSSVQTATTPEPSSLALLGTGILSVAGMAIRKLLPQA